MRKFHSYMAGSFILLSLFSQIGVAQSGADKGKDSSPSSSAAAPAQGRSGQAQSDPTYVIGDDDQLGINVWKEPDFTQDVPVRSDGRISLPLIGEMQAAGETPRQLQQEITTRLRAYITDPIVTVMVLKANSQKFNILGRVAKPGSYSLTSTTTVLDAIADAGGFTDFAKQKDIYILRHKSGGGDVRFPFNYKDVIRGKHAEQNIHLEPHDTVVVP